MAEIIHSVDIKAGILNTIAKSIYSDIGIKTREAVSNSIDNNATFFILTIDEKSKIISFYDNGNGISRITFEEIFTCIGYGRTRKDTNTNSYFGLGLMSVLQLGKQAAILTKCKDNDKINYYSIDTNKIFSEEFENCSIAEIKKLITIDDLKSTREEKSILSESILNQCAKGLLQDSFTEIILRDVDETLLGDICTEDFVKKLRKVLPLKIDYTDPFFNHIRGNKLNEIKKTIFNNRDFCKTIDLFYYKIDSDEGHRELTKYYPNFFEDVIFTDADIYLFESKDKLFKGYFLISSRDIENSKAVDNQKDHIDETGFWVRNRNYLVKAADFFQKPGSRKKIVDAPLATWIFGEVFHKDMTRMLVVTRDEYIWEDREFKIYFEELKEFIKPVNEEYRQIWQRGKRVVESIVEPFNNIKKKQFFSKFDSVLLGAQIINDVSEAVPFLSELIVEFTDRNIEDKTKIIGELLSTNNKDLLIADNIEGDTKIVISKDILVNDYSKERDPNTKGIIIKISPRVFESFKTNFLGKNFTVHYVLNSKEQADLSINSSTEEIFINIVSKDLARYRLTFVEYILITKIAFLKSNNKDEMYRLILDLIGSKDFKSSIQPGNVFSALEDIMNRRKFK